MRSADRSSPRSIPARSGDSLCAASIKPDRLRTEFPPEFTIGRNVLAHDNLAVFPQIVSMASEISSALNRDLLKRFSRRANPCRARVARTKESTLSGVTLAASDSLSPSGSSTIPPAMVCRSEESRTTKRSPTNAKCAASCWLASVSTLTSSTWPARLSAACSSAGVRARQGPHHSAQKSTTTGTSRDRSSTACWKVSCVASTAITEKDRDAGSAGPRKRVLIQSNA